MPHETSRRFILARLAAAPIALIPIGLPRVVMTRSGPVVTLGDAALIAQAETVVRLVRLSDRAQARAGRKSDAVMIAMGRRPAPPERKIGATDIEEHPVDPASDIERCFTMTFRRPPPGNSEAQQHYAEATAAWEVEQQRQHKAMGTADAGRVASALEAKKAEAVADLVAIRATTAAGLAAKAAAFHALAEDGMAEEDARELVRSLAADAIALGGHADA